MILILRRLEIVLWNGRVYYLRCVNLIKRPLCRHTNPRRGLRDDGSDRAVIPRSALQTRRVFDAQVFLLHYVTIRVKKNGVFCWIHSCDSQFKWRTDSAFMSRTCQTIRDRLDPVKVGSVHRGHSQGRDPTDPQRSPADRPDRQDGGMSFWKSCSVCLLVSHRSFQWQHTSSTSTDSPNHAPPCDVLFKYVVCVFVRVQVTVSMYKRGAQGWLGKPLIATATIPSSTRVIFRIRGETTDAKIPAGNVRSIALSIWSSRRSSDLLRNARLLQLQTLTAARAQTPTLRSLSPAIRSMKERVR